MNRKYPRVLLLLVFKQLAKLFKSLNVLNTPYRYKYLIYMRVNQFNSAVNSLRN